MLSVGEGGFFVFRVIGGVFIREREGERSRFFKFSVVFIFFGYYYIVENVWKVFFIFLKWLK